MHATRLKRGFDILGSATGLILTLPLLLLIGALIRLTMGSPILFRQNRPGRGGNPFVIYKFRTMTLPATSSDDTVLSDAQRLTPLGRFLRKTSLDELPELINVLKGEMSIVGPRPLLMQYLPRYSPEQMRRHEVRPGITGWAQVNGRNTLAWEDKFRLDVWYVDHHSLWLDMKIIGMTLAKVLQREGISHPGHATMEEFLGARSLDHLAGRDMGPYEAKQAD